MIKFDFLERLVVCFCFVICALLIAQHAQATTLLNDTFTGTTINTSNWTESDSAGGGAGGTAGNVQQNNTLNIIGNNSFGTNALQSTTTFDRTYSDIIIDADASSTACSSGFNKFGIGYGDKTIASDVYMVYQQNPGGVISLYSNISGVASNTTTTFTCTNNVSFHVQLVISRTGGAKLYINGNTSPDATVAGGTFTNKNVFLTSANNAVTVVYDTVTVKNNITNVPTIPVFADVIPNNHQVSLTWATPIDDGGSAITDYLIEYKTASGSFVPFTHASSSATSTTVTGLSNAIGYEFRVSGINANGTGLASDSAYSTPGTPLFSDTFTGTTINTAKWTETDSAGGGAGGTVGNIQQNGVMTQIGVAGAWGANGVLSVPTFNHNGGNINIDADVKTSSDPASDNLSFVLGYGPFYVPDGSNDGYFISRESGGFGGTVRLFYRRNGVEIEASTSVSFVPQTNKYFHIRLVILQAGGAQVFVNNSSVPNAVVTGSNFANNQGIYLQSQNSTGISTYDNVHVTFAPIPNAPPTPVATAGNGQASLTWTAANDNGFSLSDYFIEYKTGAGPYSVFAHSPSTTTSATITGLTNGLTYAFRVSAVNANGTSSPSYVVTTVPFTSTAAAPVALSVSIAGLPNIGQTLAGSYVFDDTNAEPEAATQYQWLQSSTLGGTYTSITGATSTVYAASSTDSGKYLKFQVTPVSLVAPTTGSAVLSAGIGPIGSSLSNSVHHILSTGQSLSLGVNGAPALSTTQPYSNVTLNNQIIGTSLVPLIEGTVVQNAVETISSAMANSITKNVSGNNYKIAVTLHGHTATAYAGLKKGTIPYGDGTYQIGAVRNATTSPYTVVAVTAIHGESDHLGSTTQAQYEADLVEWQHDYETDVNATTSQTGTLPFFTDQTSSQTYYGNATSTIPSAQLSAAENNPTKIFLIGPKYFFSYTDGVHLTNTSYRWLGEYYGKIMKRVIVDGLPWTPLSPKKITRNGNVIYAQFNVPVAPLQFDTTLMSAQTNYGFEYADDSSSASISSVSLYSPDTVKILLNSNPTGTNQVLRYAYTGTPGALAGSSGAVGGNLHDSEATTSTSGNTLYNWSVQFSKPIIADTFGPRIYYITASTTQTTATINWATDEPASFTTNYAFTSSYGLVASTSPTLATTTTITIPGLTAGTAYHFQIVATDIYGNVTTSADQTFTTAGIAPTATTFTFTGPTQGNINEASANFTVTPDYPYTGVILITPSGVGSSGIPKPSLTFSSSSVPQTFTITPVNGGVITLSATNDGNLTNPADLTYISVVPYVAPSGGGGGPWIAPVVPTPKTPVLPVYNFVKDLDIKSKGLDVKALQNILIILGFLSKDSNTGYFGPLTQNALIKYQRAKKITPAAGYFGPKTRASLKK